MLSKIGPISPAIGIVSIGGGTGLSRLLSGLKHFVRSADSKPASPTPAIEQLTAVVTVTDDGGSSDRLRREFRILPPGDIRMCMFAIFDARMALDGLPAATAGFGLRSTMNPTHVLIMAAGKGTRLKSSLPKVLHPLAGQPLVEHLLQTVEDLNPRHTLVVVGHQAAMVKSRLRHRAVEFAEQVPQLGTGHAVQVARDWWCGKPGNLLILSGDVPLISARTLRKMIQVHDRTRAGLTLLSTRLADPTGYGRVIRAEDGRVRGIVEQKEAGPSELQVKEVNTGLYCFRIPDLSEVIDRLTADNRQKEYYLTDCVGLLSRRGKAVEAVVCDDWLEVMGVNSPIDLARMETVLRERRPGHRKSHAPAGIEPGSV